MPTKTKKAVGYIRVSTSGQIQGESLSTQRQQIKDFAKQKGWELQGIYADEGISGTKIKYRLQFQQMLKDAENGKFDVIVFTKLSRFARNAREYMNLSYDLEKFGVLLASIKENIDPTTKTGKMIAGMLALFAEWESETIKEQMYENKIGRWKDKRCFIGSPPFGYRWNKESKQIEIVPEQAKIVKRIFTMYLEQRMSFRDIVIKLSQEGIKNKRRDWSGPTISYLLKNPAYYGDLTVNQFEYEDGPRGAGTVRTKNLKPASEHINYETPPIISKSRFDAIQKRVEFNKVKSKRSEKTESFILRDVLQCARCGSKAKPRIGVSRKDGTFPRYYVCYWAGTSKKNLEAAGKEKCDLPFLKAKTIESAVWADIIMKLSFSRDTILEKLEKTGTQSGKTAEFEDKIKSLETDLKKKKRARKHLFNLLEDENLDLEEIRQRLRSNRDEILQFEGWLKDRKTELAEIRELKDKTGEMENWLLSNKEKLSRLRKEIAGLDFDDKKLLVESMLDDPIKVDYQEDDEEFGPGGAEVDFRLKWNFDILRRFMDEGGISRLDKNSAHDSPTPAL